MQVLDAEACEAMRRTFEEEARQPNFPGLLVDFDHFSHDPAQPTTAAGWVSGLEHRADGLYAQIRWSDLGHQALTGGRYRLASPVWNRADCDQCVVGVANGGTGTATPSLTAGANVTITGSFPNQTISASGGSLGANNTFTGSNSFTGPVNFTGATVTGLTDADLSGLGTGVAAGLGQATNGAGGFPVLDANGLLPADPWSLNLDGQAFCFEGDSISANPNGAGYTSWTYLAQALSFFANHGSYYDAAVDGSYLGAGSNGGQTVTGSWTGATTTITLTTSPTAPAGPMSVTGTNIPAGTTGTLSGTTLTLSQPTTGSGAAVTLTLGGNNCADRYASQIYPHRPASHGGNGGPRAFLFVMVGANPIRGGESGAEVVTELTAYTTQARADGFTVVLATLLPGFNGFYNPAEETVREGVNQQIRRYLIPCDQVIDCARCLSGDSTLFDSLGAHPLTIGNNILAHFLNDQMVGGGAFYKGTEGYVENVQEFEQNVQFDANVNGPLNVQSNSTTGGEVGHFLQPYLPVGSSDYLTIGNAETQINCGVIGFDYNAAMAGANNSLSLGLWNEAGSNVYIFGDGDVNIGGVPTDQGYLLYVNGVNQPPPLGINSPSTASGQKLASFLQPNLPITSGGSNYLILGRAQDSNRQSAILSWNETSSTTSTNNNLSIAVENSPTVASFFGSGDLVVGGNTDHSNVLEVDGINQQVPLFVTSPATVSGQVMTEILQPSLPVTGENTVVIGKALDSSRQCALLEFAETGSVSSTSNNFSIGIENSGQVLYVFGSGDAAIGTSSDNGYKLEVNGTAKIDGAVSAAGFVDTSITTPGGSATTTAANHRYVCSGATSETFTLPASCAVGDTVEVIGNGATSAVFTVAKASGQAIYFGSGTAYSSIAAGAAGDAIKLTCTAANTDWSVTSSEGSFTSTP
jgi:hypothetical protein